ncbi:MAG TPA: hypothetical protein VJ718_00485 [Candidatus Binataceae bacterium]|nr:hypothetical protein [Candidatus Binataceae bacterium]
MAARLDNRTIMRWVAALAGVLFAGCLTVPLAPSGAIDPAAESKLAQEAPTYDTSKLNPDTYISVGSLTATGCDNGFLGGPGRDGVIAELRQKALAIGANGLTDVSCQHGRTSEAHQCFSSMDCSATALKVMPPGGAN